MVSTRTLRENGSYRVGVSLDAKSMTEQSHRKKCNINTIMAKARKGQMIPITEREPVFGDFTGVSDFHTAQNAVIEARSRFMELPADLRRRFGNDPGELLGFLSDPQNEAEAVELGLVARPVKPEEEAPPAPVEPVVPPEAP